MVDNAMMEKLKEIIISRQTLNKNKCGTSIMVLKDELNIDFDKTKELLNKLHAQKMIIIRQGINQKLIFLKS